MGQVFSSPSLTVLFPHRTFVHLCSLGSWTALLARTVGVDPIGHHCQQALLDSLP